KGATGDERDDFTGDDSRTAGVPPSAAPLSLTPTELWFGSLPAGSTSGAQTVTLTNTGVSPITIFNIQVTGTDASNFVVTTNTCGASLAPTANCTVSLTYTPEGVGTNTAVLSITSGPTSTSQTAQTVDLGGTGTP
ncbi:MAG: choice-of-anchor D domain-containing protein, partial [Dehalococcoidia bacterium]